MSDLTKKDYPADYKKLRESLRRGWCDNNCSKCQYGNDTPLACLCFLVADVIEALQYQNGELFTRATTAEREAARLGAENEWLKKALSAAVDDMAYIAGAIASCKEPINNNNSVSDLALGRCDVCARACHDSDGECRCRFKWRGYSREGGDING